MELGVWNLTMEIIEYFEQGETAQVYWMEQIAGGDWRAAAYLTGLLRENTFRERYGADAHLFLLTDGNALVSFCTLVQQDEILDDRLFPWIGFVYTFPAYRGHRYSEKLINHVCSLVKSMGCRRIYLSSDEQGLYEKYGFTFWQYMETTQGKMTQVFFRELFPKSTKMFC